MADGIEEGERERERRPTLIYPLEASPPFGEAVDVAPGVKWMRMPLPGSLAFINVWALEDGEGWTIVDTGMNIEACRNGWEQIFETALEGRPVTRVLVTHLHPDHVGLAGWITERFDCRLWMTRLEYLTCRVMVTDTGREAPREAVQFYRAAGWSEAALDDYRARFGGFGRVIHTLPDSFQRLRHDDVLRIGAHDWRVVVGSGHSPEHACLYCQQLKLMISGDQVLPRISSNVSVYPTEPQADPLTDWLDSLQRLERLIPDDVLVLPAHNDPFIGLHARLRYLAQGHERGLERLAKVLATPRRAVDVFRYLFGRPIGPDLLGMATGESIAHLNCLLGRGLATVSADAEGVLWYRQSAVAGALLAADGAEAEA